MAKEMKDYSEQELLKMIKTMRAILTVMGVVALLYAAYFGYLMGAGKLDNKNLIGLIPLGAMLIAGLPTMMNMNRFKAELAKRAES